MKLAFFSNNSYLYSFFVLSFAGHLDIIGIQMTNELLKWSITYQKPLIISEYGADALPGIHCVRK
jgi:hypothetical protein